MAKAILMGREGTLTVGGSEITCARDVTVSIKPKFGDTSSRATLIEQGSVVSLELSVEFEVLNKSASVGSIKSAAAAGTPVAITTDDGAGFGMKAGEFNLSLDNGQPLKGEQTLKCTATVNSDNGVTPSIS